MKKRLFATLMLVLILLLTACSSTSNSEGNKTTSKADPNKAVTIKDPQLEAVIRDEIKKPEGDILVSDMEGISSLSIDCKKTPVKQLDGLEYATKLHSFSYRYGELESLDPIANCQELEYMNVSYSTIKKQPTEFNTPVLDRASFIDTNISDFSFLKKATAMTDVSFTHCGIKSIDFLKDAKNLNRANLSDNSISNIEVLSDKVKLTSLDLQKNEISSIDALKNCTKLEYLVISYNHVQNLAPIMNFSNLEELRAYEELDKKIIDRTQIQSLIDKGVDVYYHK